MKAEGGTRQDPAERPRSFALRVIRLCSALPATPAARVIARQVLRSGTSVGAHWREARRSRSDAEFISKVEAGTQEVDETIYWLELLRDSGIVGPTRTDDLLAEAEELLAVFVACAKTVKRRSRRP
jgi:four helix bundle protein